MERLTFDGNFCDIAQCESVPGGSYCENGNCSQREVWERLKMYEDIGLPPDIIREYKKFEDELVSDGLSYAKFLKMLKERENSGKDECK